MGEDTQLIRDSLREFLSKEVAGKELHIDRNGIDAALLSRIRDQGFLAAFIPQEYGGSGLDTESYLMILNELAKYSGSLAASVFLFNSIEYRILQEIGQNGLIRELITSLGHISIDCKIFSLDRRISAGNAFLFPESSIAVAFQHDEIKVYRKDVKDIIKVRPLGFRGLNFGTFSTDKEEEIGTISKPESFLAKLMEDTSAEIASIVLGISSTALSKAVEYSRVRNAFGSPLKSFQPIAFPIAMRTAQLRILESFVLSGSERSRLDTLGEREISIDFARDATKLALQTHGGYGYIEDFGVEMLYRDALFAGSFFWPRSEHLKKFAEALYDSEAGTI